MSITDYINEKGLVPVSFHKPKKKGKTVNSAPSPFETAGQFFAPGKEVDIFVGDNVTPMKGTLTSVEWQMPVDDGPTVSYSAINHKSGLEVSGEIPLGSFVPGQPLKADSVSKDFSVSLTADAKKFAQELYGASAKLLGQQDLSVEKKPDGPPPDLSQIAADLEKLPATPKHSPYSSYQELAKAVGSIAGGDFVPQKYLAPIYDQILKPGPFTKLMDSVDVKPDPEQALKDKLMEMGKEVAYGIQKGAYKMKDGDTLAMVVNVVVPPSTSSYLIDPAAKPEATMIKTNYIKITLEVQK